MLEALSDAGELSQPKVNLHEQSQVVVGSKLGSHIWHVRWPRSSLSLLVWAVEGCGDQVSEVLWDVQKGRPMCEAEG